MKKLILLALMALVFASTQAQEQLVLTNSKFTDNWSVTLKGGVVSPIATFRGESITPANGNFFPMCRGIFGLELRKMITPVYGLGIEGEWTVNTSSWGYVKSPCMIDDQYVGVFNTINLMNLFAGYKGTPRTAEIELVLGAGWIHGYFPKSVADDPNSWGTKVGLNFNFNLDADAAWTLAFKPAVLWNMGAGGKMDMLGYDARYNGNHAYLELQAGLTYHFLNSNGTHSFTLIRAYDAAEVAALNEQINALRTRADKNEAEVKEYANRVATLQTQLDECVRQPAAVQEVVTRLNSVHYVFFNNASSTILANQQPQVAMVAEEMKANSSAKLDVKGYASPVGSLAFNERLAKKRAEVVKNELVKKYGIDANRISAQGMGVGDIFNQSSWNRVAVMTME